MPNIHVLVGETTSDVVSRPLVSLLNSLVSSGVRIRHVCGGKAQCGTCRVRVVAAEDRGLSPIGPRERERLDAIGAGADDRLACQTYASRNVTIRIPSEDKQNGS